MALSTKAHYEVRATGSDGNGGGFNPTSAGFATDLAATLATSSAPVVSSASYTFVAGDVGASVYVSAGTSWTPGWYPIASVSGGSATLGAAAGASISVLGVASTAAGCATVASPTAGTFGVDYSQQNSALVSATDLVVDGTLNTKVTSATAGFGKNHVGNIFQITAGTGFTTGFYEILTVVSGAATLDRSPAAVSTTGGSFALGGALATPAKAFTTARPGTYWVKQSTYTTTATLAPPFGGSGAPTIVAGYKTARGDGDAASDGSNNATVQATGGFSATAALFTIGATLVTLRNLTLDCNSLAKYGVQTTVSTGSYARCDNVKVTAFTGRGFEFNTVASARRCAATGGISGATAAFWGDGTTGQRLEECVASGNPCPGLLSAGYVIAAIDCFFLNATGATGHGVQYTGNAGLLRNCTIAGNAGDGINFSGNALDFGSWAGTILANNAGYGIRSTGANLAGEISPGLDYVAFYSNALGNRSNVPAGAHDVVLTADPFTNSAGGDYTLNNGTPGGAQLRAAGAAGAVFYLATTAEARPFGAVTPVASGGGGGGMSKSRIIGGI